ncbi:ATP synthase subunit b [Devosia pacifica]|uniref:ATP synthase subunit b n=1 Tax=Devosia pacifica TaxID=1335967 RepID=A0A918VW48_9HYPH|nr:ATP F0F1 synthase subunit B [Devosia pacifica]GHA30496.1 ATP synthase subunit b [Devosia pacifica]
MASEATEAETPTEENLDAAVDATHGGSVGETHAATEDHGGTFPPFDPATFPSQLLWLAITFAALYLLMSRIALPQIGGVIADRRARVDADLKAADESRRKTDAAIAAYEEALASARAKAQGIANETRESIQADLASKRAAVEADLSEKLTAAEARIAETKAQALSHVDEIAAETAQAVASQLIGDVPQEQAQAAVSRVKE